MNLTPFPDRPRFRTPFPQEQWVVASRTRCKEQHALRTVPGIGRILGLTIALETGDITRFASVGDYASYCRLVKSERISNGKRKGCGNRKCGGNCYLAWAWIEAANFTLRFSPPIRRWYDRKCSKCHKVIAIKAVAHKLARRLLPHARRRHVRRAARARMNLFADDDKLATGLAINQHSE